MSPLTHFMASWLVAAATTENPRDRRLITIAGVIPDTDGFGMIADMVKSVATGEPTTFFYYQRYHHYLGHGWPAAIVFTLAFACVARQRWRTALLCLAMFHLHLLCDFIASRGPTPGDIWPILYGEPVSRHPVWMWKGQWQLDGWQNRIIAVLLVFAVLGVTARRGISCLEVFNRRLDAGFARVIQKWYSAFRPRPTTRENTGPQDQI